MIYSVLLRCWIAAQDPTRPRLPATADRSALHGRRPFFSSRHPAKHSAAILNLTTSPAVEGQTGLYFNGLHEARAQAQAYDLDAHRELQGLSLALTGLSAEGVAALER